MPNEHRGRLTLVGVVLVALLVLVAAVYVGGSVGLLTR